MMFSVANHEMLKMKVLNLIMQVGNMTIPMTTSTTRQRRGMHENIVKHANDKCHVVIVLDYWFTLLALV